ncbi:class I SAM-dependent methyltransferase family protein [Candidatus Micrarchaeota archaeon]|nr:class I SAM-dependent methyltransferase family protein [Candidatus Micrarchaeota archaeon]
MKFEKCLCVKIPKKHAQETREKLISLDLIDLFHKPKAIGNFVYFPVVTKPKNYKTTFAQLTKRDLKPNNLKEALKNSLNDKEIEHLTSSFDIIGDIAILEVADELKKKEETIAKAITEVNKSIKVVLAKEGKREGVFRLRKLRHIFGEKRTVTVHKENNCRFKLDVAKAYFSPRLVFERSRIAGLIKSGETVVVMFAGVGPFAIILAKNNPSSNVFAIELNPHAFRYMKDNVSLNKCTNVTPVFGDVKKLVPNKFINFADRVLMPLPKGAEAFLKEAFLAAKKNCIIHLYTFANERDPFSKAIEKIKKEAKRMKRKVKIINKRAVKPYAPYIVQIVIDFLVK